MGTDRDGADAATLHRAMFDAIGRRDFDALRGLFHPDAVHVSGSGEAGTGPEPVVTEVQGFVEAFPDLAIDIVRQHVPDPSCSVVEYTFRGTHEGPLDDIAPTRRRVAVRACSVLEAESGSISRESDYFDTMDMLDQLGVAER